MSFKQEVHAYCQQLVEIQIARSQQLIVEAQTAANQDSKSSMGDKYETNREMMALEIAKAGEQLQEGSKLKRVLSELNPINITKKVALGSLISTNIGFFYLAVSLGKINVGDEEIFVLSAVSPLGKVFIDKQSGSEFEFNARTIKIHSVE